MLRLQGWMRPENIKNSPKICWQLSSHDNSFGTSTSSKNLLLSYFSGYECLGTDCILSNYVMQDVTQECLFWLSRHMALALLKIRNKGSPSHIAWGHQGRQAFLQPDYYKGPQHLLSSPKKQTYLASKFLGMCSCCMTWEHICRCHQCNCDAA